MTDTIDRSTLPAQARCFKCGTLTQTLRPDEGMMDGASAWYTNGNYGSRLIDGGKHVLEIHICDLCLLLARDRVLQYERHLLDERKNRIYEAWDPPKVGPDPRRRVLVVWEDEHGRYCMADQGGGGVGWTTHDTVQGAFKRIEDRDEYMRTACTVSACKARVVERAGEDPDHPKSGILIGHALELLDVLGARFPKGEFWCEHSEEPATIDLTVIVWPGVRLTVVVRSANSEQRVFFEIFDQHKPETKYFSESIRGAVACIETYGAPTREEESA